MVAVYETIDLGMVSMLSRPAPSEPSSWLGQQQTKSSDLLELLHANHPVFASDPIYNDTVYLYHTFGVHSLNMSHWLQPLASSLSGHVDEEVGRLVKEARGTEVTSLMDSFSPQLRYISGTYRD
jgi:nucleoporin NUP82